MADSEGLSLNVSSKSLDVALNYAVHSGHALLDAAVPGHPSTMAVSAADAPENVAGADDGALPIPVDLFPFSTPSLDLTQDWSWLQQNSLPAFPGDPDQAGHIDGEHEVAGLVRAPHSIRTSLVDTSNNFFPVGYER